MTMDSALLELNDNDLWEAVKSRIFKAHTTWDLLVAKVRTIHPKDTRKRMEQMFEEMEFILSMFNKVVKESYSGHVLQLTVEQLEDCNFVLPDTYISQFLGVTPHTTKIYFRDDWDAGYSYLADPPSEPNCILRIKEEIKEGSDDDHLFGNKSDASDIGDDNFMLDKSDVDFVKTEVPDDTTDANEKNLLEDTPAHHRGYPVTKEQYNQMRAGKIPKQCPKCSKLLKTMESLRRHFKRKNCHPKDPEGLEFSVEDPSNGVTRYGCTFDGCYEENKKLWMYRISVHSHYQEKHCELSDLNFSCKWCSKKFLTIRLLKSHSDKLHVKNGKKSVKVESRFESGDWRPSVWEPSFPVDQDTFTKMKKREIALICPKCKQTFGKWMSLFRHFAKKIKCIPDHKAVVAPPDMVIEINDEVTKKSRYACAFINCPQYGKTWANKDGVRNHWQNEHIDSVENTVQCKFCPKKLVSTLMLAQHMKISHCKLEGKEYTCTVCGIVKTSLQYLKSHEKTHQTFSVTCEFCDFKSNSRTNLNSHLRSMHADKMGVKLKYHQCEHCGKNFKTIGNLREHERYIHSGQGPDPKYKCHICSKQLKQDNSYRKHMANSHGVGERCELCNKLYRTKSLLEIHKRKVHE